MITSHIPHDKQEIVLSLRKSGKSFVYISKITGLNRNKIGMFCKENDCGAVMHPSVQRRIDIRKAQRIKDNTYVCKQCGETYIRSVNRYGDQGKTFCSRECSFQYLKDNPAEKKEIIPVSTIRCLINIINCEICGNVFTSHQGRLLCSDNCQRIKNGIYALKASKKAHYEKKKAHYEKNTDLTCKECGVLFTPQYGEKHRKYCSVKCSSRYSNRVGKQKRRVRDKAAFVEVVLISVLLERDKRCQLCNRKLNSKHSVPSPKAPTIDHIIPISLGGEHSYRNTQLACFECNTLKGNGTVKGREQLLLFG